MVNAIMLWKKLLQFDLNTGTEGIKAECLTAQTYRPTQVVKQNWLICKAFAIMEIRVSYEHVVKS